MNTADLAAPVDAASSSDSTEGPAPTFARERGFALLVTAGFAVVVGVLLWRHTPWRDELQAWAIARDNPNLGNLFAQLHYEGHPALWYLVLWVPARVTRSITALQIVQWTFAVGAAFLVARWAPFSRTARVLLLASYFPLFEYGVVARSYTLVWFLTIATLVLLPRRHGLIALGIGTALLANTTVLAIPLALALVVGVLADRAVQPVDANRASRIGAGLAVTVGALIALLTARPAPDAAHAIASFTDRGDRLARDLSAPARALAPIPNSLTHFWDSVIFDRVPTLAALLGVAVIVGIGVVLRHRRAALITWLVPALTVPAILYSRDLFASLRFAGIIFVAAVAALWLARTQDRTSRSIAITITTIGTIGTLASVVAVFATWSQPFSGASATAQWLRANGYQDSPIVCSTNYQCSSVGIRLDRPTESADAEGRFTYATFRGGRIRADDRSVVTLAQARATEEGVPVIVLTATTPDDPRATVLARFNDSVVADETYWVAVVRPAG